jgi:hypothetical protein
MVSLASILASSLLGQGPALPRLWHADRAWKQTVEEVVRFNPPDAFEEKKVFEETVAYRHEKGVTYLERSRSLRDSWIDGQKIPGPEIAMPMAVTEVYSKGAWPTLAPEFDDAYSLRLWRATRYVPDRSFSIAADRTKGLPAATYEARVIKGEVQTTFRESTGLVARGIWKYDDKQRLLSAKITCENAFAPGGDGTKATFIVTIAVQKG